MKQDFSGAEVTKTALVELADDFKHNPVDFFLGSDVQTRGFVEILRS